MANRIGNNKNKLALINRIDKNYQKTEIRFGLILVPETTDYNYNVVS